MRISMLIPCYNEEATLRKSIASWLSQTRPADEIIVVDDCSSDRTPEILKEFEGQVTAVRPPLNTGNKSFAQEYGLQFVTGDVFIATDGDTVLDEHFVENIEKDFLDNSVAAVGGYVRSLPYNWLTAARGLDYAIGQNIDKLAQDYLHFMFVIPGAAGAFRTDIFRSIEMEHDVLTEDLDFTYKLHEQGYQIKYDRDAICYTQDPVTMFAYINQMRRWYGGGWQSFIKHFQIPNRAGMALELTLIYGEGLIYSFVMLAMPLINFFMALVFMGIIFVVVSIMALWVSTKERRPDFLLAIPAYLLLKYVNAWVYLEQFGAEVIMRRRNLMWFKPERVKI